MFDINYFLMESMQEIKMVLLVKCGSRAINCLLAIKLFFYMSTFKILLSVLMQQYFRYCYLMFLFIVIVLNIKTYLSFALKLVEKVLVCAEQMNDHLYYQRNLDAYSQSFLMLAKLVFFLLKT